jgi:hypothetical protein
MVVNKGSSAAAMTVRRFAYTVAGPRDFVINLVVNGSIAWLVFGRHETVPLVGWGSIWVMLLPMSLLESGLTTFFGCLAGALKRKAGLLAPPLDPAAAWLDVAVREGLLWGMGALGVAVTLMLALAATGVQVQLPAWQVIVGVGLLSGVLAYALHTRAVLRAGRL